GLVRPHARAAQGRAQHRVVDRDDGLQAGVLVVAEHDLLVAVGIQVLEDHSGLRSRLTLPREGAGRPVVGGVSVVAAATTPDGSGRATGRAFYAGPAAISRARAYGNMPQRSIRAAIPAAAS